MTINFHAPANFQNLIRSMTKAVEGANLTTPTAVTGDREPTLTFGFGYTFVRGGSVYPNLVSDLAKTGIDIALTKTENEALTAVAAAQAKAKKDAATAPLLNGKPPPPDYTETRRLIN